ncbi:hypothetical protein, partial [Parabacteroides sp. FAFU027]|uniref:HYR-like domain-containing protein n=1 Tax=Parabacteroides sp. FAFU027 TaxID=2922715 RepID=UPI001FAF3E7C
NILTPTVSEPTLISCDGNMTYVFTYKDCSGHSHDWSYIYTIAQPDFTLPASGDSTVNCPADAVRPTAPVVKDACGNILTPTITEPTLISCEGNMTYVFTYQDCSGHSHDWSYVYTIAQPDFMLPANGDSTVNCPADAVRPTAPVVKDACGNILTPTVTEPSLISCEGNMTYVFTYKDCSGHSHDWSYIYTIAQPDFTLPANGDSTVNCPADAIRPTAPVVKDACGNILTPTVSEPTLISCDGNMTYVFTYKDCSGHSHDWSYIYTIAQPDFTLPANGDSTVNCPADAVRPTAPVVKDACGNILTPTITEPTLISCEGNMTYVFTYQDCSGHSHDWSYVYTIAQPDFMLPANGDSTVNCPADAVRPTAPVVKDACGNILTPTITEPTLISCEGNMTYVFTYQDCSGHSHDWSYVYTIAQPDFMLPANGDSTVNCPAEAVQPTAPVVKDACGNDLTPTLTSPSLISCDGNMTYVFTYKDCSGHTHDWSYVYTIAQPDFTLPANVSDTVNCPADTVRPTAPVVKDACGNDLTPTVTSPSLISCDGNMTYVFTYKDCSGHTHDWSYVYTIAQPDFTLPADGSSTVNCPAEAVQPTAPVVKDACGNDLTPTLTSPSLISCDGNMTYVFTYKDCSGHTHDWSYVYTIAQPDFTLPANVSDT